MRFSLISALTVALAANNAIASSWFGKAAYNNWHETELERWLSDHDVPYPTPADRKDLENLVKENWNTKMKKYWYETEDQASDSYHSVKDWIFDSWTESQLKAFLDYHGIPNPQPRNRDSLLKTARENYQSAANKIGETAAYPGDWLYESWSDSDLKSWLDERGYPAPQTSSRDKLIAAVRRNARYAGQSMRNGALSVSSAASSATQSLSDDLLNSWSDSQIKEWADKNGIKVPQGSKRNELLALARKHRNNLSASGTSVASSASSMYGAATSSAGNMGAQATSTAAGLAQQVTDYIKNMIGMGSASATSAASRATGGVGASVKSATSVVGASASSAAERAKASASSASAAGSSSISSGGSAASASASSAASAASASASSAKSAASKSASSASASVKGEL
ncbi:hypothetical protein W97_04633 [Coniosporium apollinis CBS 100218]|uniref:Stress response protein ish1 n=1 Tax=Coniosporium apollinis (strain CBS 100218) TaxID=1168221 RepID=R7YU21_CONA1|nr:uncharacterized protein W97_04633 [Coniosporium apollinis CBS 100218]EON65395.1 hypothetical protein W97_04633 [Coniosporium apollinis CBS 100218]